jgi:hypothetical protein
MDDAHWMALPAAFRDELDALICRRQWMAAILAFRERSGIDPEPSLSAAMDLLGYRTPLLHKQGLIDPEPETTVEDMLADVAAIDARPVAVEAWWDGDSRGWHVGLSVVFDRPGPEHPRYVAVGVARFVPHLDRVERVEHEAMAHAGTRLRRRHRYDHVSKDQREVHVLVVQYAG